MRSLNPGATIFQQGQRLLVAGLFEEMTQASRQAAPQSLVLGLDGLRNLLQRLEVGGGIRIAQSVVTDDSETLLQEAFEGWKI